MTGRNGAGTHSDGRKQGRQSADGCGEDRASEVKVGAGEAGPLTVNRFIHVWLCNLHRYAHNAWAHGMLRADF